MTDEYEAPYAYALGGPLTCVPITSVITTGLPRSDAGPSLLTIAGSEVHDYITGFKTSESTLSPATSSQR